MKLADFAVNTPCEFTSKLFPIFKLPPVIMALEQVRAPVFVTLNGALFLSVLPAQYAIAPDVLSEHKPILPDINVFVDMVKSAICPDLEISLPSNVNVLAVVSTYRSFLCYLAYPD